MIWCSFCWIGSKFWRFDPLQRPPVKSTYPKPLSNWEGIPDGINAAFQYTNGYTYFFKKGTYYRFNDRNFAVSDTFLLLLLIVLIFESTQLLILISNVFSPPVNYSISLDFSLLPCYFILLLLLF